MQVNLMGYSVKKMKLDSLVREPESEYAEIAPVRELYQTMLKSDTETKEKRLKTIELWAK